MNMNNNMNYLYPMRTSNGIIWVQGIEGAKAYQLTPNSNVVLLDSENDRFYIKSCDNIGMCDLRAFNYTEITEFSKNSENYVDTSQFITRDELNEILDSKLKEKHNVKQAIQPNEHKSKTITK